MAFVRTHIIVIVSTTSSISVLCCHHYNVAHTCTCLALFPCPYCLSSLSLLLCAVLLSHVCVMYLSAFVSCVLFSTHNRVFLSSVHLSGLSLSVCSSFLFASPYPTFVFSILPALSLSLFSPRRVVCLTTLAVPSCSRECLYKPTPQCVYH